MIVAAAGQSVAPVTSPAASPSMAPLAGGAWRCMNRGSSPSYSWTNFLVSWVGGALTVTIDDGNLANPAFRDWCWNMDPANDEPVKIFYQQLGGRQLGASEEGSDRGSKFADSAHSRTKVATIVMQVRVRPARRWISQALTRMIMG